jgi:FeS assembly SUF system regulator
MIKLSRLADYGMILMSRIARDGPAVHNAVDLAAETGLPVPTVSKLLGRFAHDGLLISHRGAKGGYELSRVPAEITVAQIIAAVDGPIALTLCIEGPGACEVEALCPTRTGWHRINRALKDALEQVSLAEIAALSLVPFGAAHAPTPNAEANPR